MRCYLIPLCLLLLLSAGCGPKHYTATTTIQIEHHYGLMEFRSKASAEAHEANYGVTSKVVMLEGGTILKDVVQSLEASNSFEEIAAPYQREATSSNVERILSEHGSFEVIPKALMIDVSYSHPVPDIAALVANTFAEVFIEQNSQLELDRFMKKIEDLRIRVDTQKERVEEVELALTRIREEKNIDPEIHKSLLRELKVQNTYLKFLEDSIMQEKDYNATRIYARIIDRAVAPTH